jgi:autotransporter-associated beta strand protein
VTLLGLLAVGGPAAAQTYTWNWVTGTASTFTDPGWDTAPPNLGSASTALVLNFAGGLPGSTAYTLTNNLGSPQFDLNTLTFNTLSSSGGFTFASAAGHSLRFNGADAVINQDGLGLVTVSSAITLNAGAVVRIGTTNPVFGLGDITLSGIISGAGGLVVGNGASGNAPTPNTRVVRLTGANTFTGGVTLDGGNLSVSGSTALGAGGAFTVTANGGTLVGSATGLGVTSWVLNGPLQLSGSIQLNSNTLVSGAGDLIVRGFGTIQSASAAFTGTVTAAGTLTLSGNSGALAGVNTFNVSAGGTLALSSNVAGSTANADRIADTASVNLNGGNLTLTGAASATALAERFGVLTGTGYNTITVNVGSGGQTIVLHAGSLARVDRGTFLIRGIALGVTRAFTFTTAPTGDLIGGGGPAGSPTVSILPYAIGDPTTGTPGTALVTLDVTANGGVAGTTGVRPLTDGEYVGNLTSGPTTNVQLTSTVANAGTATINALVLRSSSVIGTGTLNITSGVILNGWSGAGQISNHVAFGAAEGQIFTADALTVSGNLTGSNGLTKSGVRALILSGNNTGLTGRLTVNDGMVAFDSPAALPGTGTIAARGSGFFSTNPFSGAVDASGAALRYTGGTPATLARDIAVGSGWLYLDSTNPAAPLTLSGVVSGAGGLRVGFSSASVVALTGANTYTGTTYVNQGVLVISSDASLGVGGGLDLFTEARSFDTSREGIRLAGDWTTARPINFSESSFVDTQGHTAVWDGVVTGISFSRLIKAGSGLLQLNAASPYPGGVILIAGGGEVRLARNGVLLSPSYTLEAGTTLHLDNTVLPAGSGAGPVTTNRVNDAAVVNLTSATLRLTGNGSQNTTERIGDVIVTGSGNGIEVLSAGGRTTSLVVNNLSTASVPVLVRGTGLGGTGGSHGRLFLSQINGLAASNGLFLGGVTAEDLTAPGVIDQAVYDTAVGVRRLNPATDFITGPAIQNAAPTNLPAAANFRVNPAVANPVPVLDAANTVGSLRFAPNGVADYAGGVAGTLTVTSGVIATEAGGPAAVTNTGTGRLTLTAGARPLFITTPSDLTLNAALGGSGGVVKSGAGTLTLNAASTNTGPLTVNAGGVALGANLTVGGLTGVTGTAFDLGANTLTLNAASGVSSYAGVIRGSGSISINRNLTLGGNNTFSGGAVSAAGGFILDHPNGLGSGPVTFTGLGGSITFNTGTVTFANDITLSAPTSTAIFSFGIPSGSDQTLTLAGRIQGGSSPSYFRPFSSSSNGIVLANPNNTFTGIIDVQSGFLAVASNSALGNPANPISVFGGGLRFDADFTGGNVLARNISLGGTPTLNTNGHTVEVSGVVSGGSLAKTGTGTLILSGTANTYNGNVTVDAGTLLVNGNLPGITSAPAVTVNAGSTLGGTGTLGTTTATRNVTVAPGGTLAPGGASSIGTLSVNGNTTLTAAAPGTGATLAVRAARSGVNTIGANDRLAYTGNLNFTGLAAGTPTAGDNKFRITVTSDAANPLVGGESYTLTLASLVTGGTGQIQRNGTQVNTAAYTFSPNDYQLSSPSFAAFTGVSLVANPDGTLVLAFTPVPEPASVLAVCGLATAAGWVLRLRRSA